MFLKWIPKVFDCKVDDDPARPIFRVSTLSTGRRTWLPLAVSAFKDLDQNTCPLIGEESCRWGLVVESTCPQNTTPTEGVQLSIRGRWDNISIDQREMALTARLVLVIVPIPCTIDTCIVPLCVRETKQETRHTEVNELERKVGEAGKVLPTRPSTFSNWARSNVNQRACIGRKMGTWADGLNS